MPVPSISGIPLCLPGQPCCGSAFELPSPAVEDEVVLLNGWQVEVTAGQRLVVARGGLAANYDDALTSALAMAQKALDLMSLRGANNLMINSFDDSHITWWLETGGLAIRIVEIVSMGITLQSVTVTVTDRQGKLVQQPTPAPMFWHESYRYFRQSQTTDDLFDAYRNAYLALESVLSSITPQKLKPNGKVDEGESQWFMRALSEADRVVPLTRFAPTGTMNAVQYLYDELFVQMRSAMSHAKSGRAILLPQNDAERQAVSESLQRLVKLYLGLAEAHLGARRAGGGVFAGAFHMMTAPRLDSMTVYVTDDESPLEGADTNGSLGGALVEMHPAALASESAPFVVVRLWSLPVRDLTALPFVRRAVGTIGGHPIIGARLEGRLDPRSAERLEVMLGVRGTNTRQPRQRYSS